MKEKNPLLGTSAMLLSVILMLGAYSFSGTSLSMFGAELKQPGIWEFLTQKEPIRAKTPAAVADRKDTSTAPVAEEAKARQVDTSAQRILMVGESMIEGIYLNMIPYAKKNGHYLKAQIWYGSGTPDWAQRDTLRKLIKWFRPSLLIVSIGSNELLLRNVKKTREPHVKNILEQIGNTPYIWVGPPNWKKDTGLGEVLESNIPQEQYFMSRYMTFKRRRDGAHPNVPSCKKWTDSLAVWIMEKSAYPIKLYK